MEVEAEGEEEDLMVQMTASQGRGKCRDGVSVKVVKQDVH